jgi:beta-glucanase (GH16 family)
MPPGETCPLATREATAAPGEGKGPAGQTSDVTGRAVRIGAAVLAVACGLAQACDASSAFTFDDEFSGPSGARPPANWSYDIGNRGWGNHEAETYTSSRANSYEDGAGHLVIKAVREPDGTWTSARLVTLGHFSQTYGTFAARIKFPGGAGMWPAFWLLGDNGEAGGEIDIAEEYGNPAWGNSSSSVYGQHDSASRATGDTHAGTGWHVWAMSWSSTSVKFFEDGKLLLTVKAFPGWPRSGMYMILNLAVGGSGGGPIPAATTSAEMLVDWIRVSSG